MRELGFAVLAIIAAVMPSAAYDTSLEKTCWTVGERVIAVFLSGQVAGVRAEERTVVVNATGTKHLHLELPCGTKAKVFDTFGMEKNNIVLGRGIRKIEVPVSGYVELLAE